MANLLWKMFLFLANQKLKITGIGFKPLEQNAGFEIKMHQAVDMSAMLNAIDKDLVI